jgi:hypothetical protein
MILRHTLGAGGFISVGLRTPPFRSLRRYGRHKTAVG